MVLRISKLWGKTEDKEADISDSDAVPQDIDNLFLKSRMNDYMAEHQDKTQMTDITRKYLDAIARLLNFFNKQEGITATFRHFDYLFEEGGQMGVMSSVII